MGAPTDVEAVYQQTWARDVDDDLTRVFDAHHARLFRLARRLTGSHDDARDLVQETFVRVARAPGSLPVGLEREQAWLIRTLVNLCRDRGRRAVVRVRHAAAHPPEAATGDPEAAYIARMTVERAMSALDARRRAIVVLHEIEGESVKQIAHTLGIAPVTVRWHLSRARRQLCRVLSGSEGMRNV
jgi:RNA polymerase sigma-70 factor (ECF subfamily)